MHSGINTFKNVAYL